jgi:hypothetical protein
MSTAYPNVQIVSVEDLIGGRRPNLPTTILPYIQDVPKKDHEQVSLFDTR